MREVEHFILLDEQLKFGCREAVLTQDAKAAGEAAVKLELNPDADPTAPEPDPTQAAEPGAEVTNTPAEATTEAVKARPRAKPAAKPKSKPKDAYVPPPGTESVPEAPAEASESDPKAQ